MIQSSAQKKSELLITEDGSHTLFVPEIDECYHSSHGAIQESKHIFIDAGLKQCVKSEIEVLEIGFGTGLNAFLSMMEIEKSITRINFTSLEKYPIEIGKAILLNYPEKISPVHRRSFELMHTSAWNRPVQISQNFSLLKIQTDFTCFNFSEVYDVVFFDAFSPDKQPEMWSEDLFKTIFKHCNEGAILTTYCAKGNVRRCMQAAGFIVERIPGPPGKREILRGRKLNTVFDNI